jgi:DNA-binding helix-hairpin-helix protein with protein kinase domain
MTSAAANPVPSRINRGAFIGEGGEGKIFEVEGRPDLCIKVYHHPITAKKAAKIHSMIGRAPRGVEGFAAWPLMLLQGNQGASNAVVMPRIANGRDIHLLYSPKARRQHFPRADWSFLVLAAQNLAGAFSNVHTIGCVIGDVNHGSVLVKENAQVALIDCDSFQLRTDAQLYECEVAVPTFTPPELQGRSLRGVERTVNHDAFGLAVLIFHMLFMGRHPFAGKPLTRADVSIEDAIRDYRFAFSADRARVQLDPPPHTLPLAAVSPDVATMFELAFGRTGRRPSPLEWNEALGVLRGNLGRCRKEASHAYFKGLSHCPWCRIETESGAILFYSPTHTFAAPPVQRDELGIGTVDGLGRAIALIVRPVPIAAPSRNILAAKPSPSATAVRIGSFASVISRISYAVSAASGIGAGVLAPQQPMAWAASAASGFWAAKLALSTINRGKVNAIALDYQAAKTRWESLQARWRSEADAGAYDTALTQYTRMRQEHERLADPIRRKVQQRAQNHAAATQRWTNDVARRAVEVRRRQTITVGLTDAELAAAYDAQMEVHFDRFSIDKAIIPDIGASRKAKLASFGVETAGDITQHKVQSVPGFGPSFTRRLLDWRKEVTAKFSFDQQKAQEDIRSGRVHPSMPPAAPPAITVDETTKRRLRQIEAELSAGVAKLQHMAATIRARQEGLIAEARLLAAQFGQAEADARAAKIIT